VRVAGNPRGHAGRAPPHARLACAGRERYIRSLPAEWTIERARSFLLTFGMYQGRTLAEVARIPDWGSIRWLGPERPLMPILVNRRVKYIAAAV
jgi:hypothetical protein